MGAGPGSLCQHRMLLKSPNAKARAPAVGRSSQDCGGAHHVSECAPIKDCAPVLGHSSRDGAMAFK
eukprot:8960143-Alexandrium_andersonii.AAC.1